MSQDFAFQILDVVRTGALEFVAGGFALASLIAMLRLVAPGSSAWSLQEAAGVAVLAFLAVFFSKFWWLWMIVAGLALWVARAKTEPHSIARLRLVIKERLSLPSILLGATALTIVMCAPEIVRYWDQSGWMDSRGYDELAHRIATGAAPLGSNSVMPLYQYGMASLFWIFGHFFPVQQIGNLAMATVGTLAFTAAAHRLFEDRLITVLAGVLIACWPTFRQTVWYTQIESWYVPMVAVSLLALVHYRQCRTGAAVFLLALAACALFNMRLQGAFYAAALGLAPFVASSLTSRQRLQHLALFGAVFFVVGVLPWSIRNAMVEGRFSPSSLQSIEYTALLNDPRVPLYGLRYWEGTDAARAEWAHRFPKEQERLAAQGRYLRERLIEDPVYFIKALPFRAAAFYGVLPGGYLNADAIVPPASAAAVWREFLQKRAYWIPVALSLFGLAAAGSSPFAWYLTVLILANVSVAFLVGGTTDPRFAYPALLVHFLLGLALFRRFRAPDPTLMANRSSRLRAKNLAGAAVLIAAAIAVLRINFGAPYAFRPIMAESWLYKPEVTIDPALPVLNATGPELVVNDIRTTNLPSGAHYATRLQISNDMLPPRYVSGIKGIPDPIAEPQSVQYFYAYIPGGYTLFGARFSGTETVAPVKERSTVWAQIRIDARTVWQGQETYWILVEKIIPTP